MSLLSIGELIMTAFAVEWVFLDARRRRFARPKWLAAVLLLQPVGVWFYLAAVRRKVKPDRASPIEYA